MKRVLFAIILTSTTINISAAWNDIHIEYMKIWASNFKVKSKAVDKEMGEGGNPVIKVTQYLDPVITPGFAVIVKDLKTGKFYATVVQNIGETPVIEPVEDFRQENPGVLSDDLFGKYKKLINKYEEKTKKPSFKWRDYNWTVPASALE